MDWPYPSVDIVEECMRDGLQIEDVTIPVEDKVRLLDALSDTGLRTIVVGSFVNPRWTPQMADVETLLERFTPRPDVKYTALALNDRGRERMNAFMPPLTAPPTTPRTLVHLCDVFARRNTNRGQDAEIASWQGTVERARSAGVRDGAIAINAAWGSNWLGAFTQEQRMELLERQWGVWNDAGIPVTKVWIGDPMAWNVPDQVGEQVEAIRGRWPEITTFHLHFHNARGSALTSAYTALRALDQRHHLILDSALGGMGGCPYCGHGRLAQMIPTEDLVDLLEELGIPTGVDLTKLIECAVLAEEIVGHALNGHVSKAGPRPRGSALFAMDMPFVETSAQAQHFRLGRSVYEGAPRPWKQPIVSPAREGRSEDQDKMRTAS